MSQTCQWQTRPLAAMNTGKRGRTGIERSSLFQLRLLFSCLAIVSSANLAAVACSLERNKAVFFFSNFVILLCAVFLARPRCTSGKERGEELRCANILRRISHGLALPARCWPVRNRLGDRPQIYGRILAPVAHHPHSPR